MKYEIINQINKLKKMKYEIINQINLIFLLSIFIFLLFFI